MQVRLNSPRGRKKCRPKQTRTGQILGKFKATSAVQIVSKEKKNDHKCYAAANCNRPDLLFSAFPSGTQQLKKWEICMKSLRGDGFFATVGNRFCFSEHFLLTDFKRTLTGHRQDLKRTIGLSLDKSG